MTEPSLSRRARWLMSFLVVAAGLLVYHNSFTGAFVFDDEGSILRNPTIRHLWPIWQCLSPPHGDRLTVDGRPFINLSLGINYALGGYNVWGYHALNLTVHILAGLTLLGIVRRTLLQPALRERFGAVANELALAAAVLWTVHPLQTESVTYVVQRAESIMGLFYLLTLYCFIRGVESRVPRVWYGLSVVACALGMASKEVMASAPLMVLLYDRAFLSRSFREAWRRRRPLYLGLSATWILLGYLLTLTLDTASMTARRLGITWWRYLGTEPGAILYYLRLSVWPSPLCLDHGWPIARTWTGILPPAIIVLILLGASAWAWRRNPVWGFVGAWFFLILAPSSSFVPLHSPIYEHRMYLSLAVLVCLAALGLYSLAGRRSLVVLAVVAIGLGFVTWRRNQDYRNEIAIWADAVAKIPDNPLARYYLGGALGRAGRIQEEIGHYEKALQLKPDFLEAHNNLGIALARNGRIEEAIGHFRQALRIKPEYAEAHYNWGNILVQVGKVQEAIGHYEEALRIKPDYTEAGNNLAWRLATLAPAEGGDPVRAVMLAEHGCEIAGNQTATYLDTLAVAYAAAGRFSNAIATAQKAVELAHSDGRPELAREIDARLQLYRVGCPYRQDAGVTAPHNP